MWVQAEVTLRARSRGFHLITKEVLQGIPEVASVKIGLLHVHIQHTSASLSINENADPSVRADFESFFNVLVPERAPYFTHLDEGDDDMPAHLKSSLLGSSVTIPISNGRFNLGVWQGVYLCEHRDHAGSRLLLLTLQGETM